MPLFTIDQIEVFFMNERELSELKHQYGNEVFGAKLIIKNLTHIISTGQCSEEEKAKCQKLLELLSIKIDNARELNKKVTI